MCVSDIIRSVCETVVSKNMTSFIRDNQVHDDSALSFMQMWANYALHWRSLNFSTTVRTSP